VIVSFKFAKYFTSLLDALTSLLYCVARTYSFAGHQRVWRSEFQISKFTHSTIQGFIYFSVPISVLSSYILAFSWSEIVI
jgi:hypothetical protein